MKTYEQQTLQFGEDGLTCFPEGFPANRSARQGKEKVRRTTATYGRKCFEQFARFPRVGSWAKTFSELLIGTGEWYSNRCALTWRLKGTKFNRMYFQLAVSTLPIKGSVHGLLPTAQTQGLKVCKNGKTVFMNLEMLPTPRASKITGGDRADFTPSLPGLAIKGLLPTPNASEGAKYAKTYNPNSQMGKGLTALAMNGMLPTPRAFCYKDMKTDRGKSNLGEVIMSKYSTGKTSQLNPLFVAEMMGFPVNWTVLPFLPGAEKASKPTGTR